MENVENLTKKGISFEDDNLMVTKKNKKLNKEN